MNVALSAIKQTFLPVQVFRHAQYYYFHHLLCHLSTQSYYI